MKVYLCLYLCLYLCIPHSHTPSSLICIVFAVMTEAVQWLTPAALHSSAHPLSLSSFSPSLCSGDGHCFCNTCIRSWLGRSQICPIDRQPLTTHIFPNRIARNMVCGHGLLPVYLLLVDQRSGGSLSLQPSAVSLDRTIDCGGVSPASLRIPHGWLRERGPWLCF
jgi:hypothetical protein